MRKTLLILALILVGCGGGPQKNKEIAKGPPGGAYPGAQANGLPKFDASGAGAQQLFLQLGQQGLKRLRLAFEFHVHLADAQRADLKIFDALQLSLPTWAVYAAIPGQAAA